MLCLEKGFINRLIWPAQEVVAWKNSRLVGALTKHPLANQSAEIATLGRFTINLQLQYQ